MSTSSISPSDLTYPRQRARTRGFRLGVPRQATPSPDGSRVVFVRSASGTDPVGDLWVLDIDAATQSAAERRVIDARSLLAGDSQEDLPDAERARRERLREVGEGIAAFATDAAVRRATFALAGRVHVVDLTDAAAAPARMPTFRGSMQVRSTRAYPPMAPGWVSSSDRHS